LNTLIDNLKGNLAMVLSDRPVFELMPIIESNKIATVAKVGVVSPVSVVVPAGPTGMDPS
jgi:large subunit ribosomal protein LP0